VGAHPFRAECLKTELERHLDEHGDIDRGVLAHALVALLHDLDHGSCPRCQGPLRPFDDDEPVGSRVVACHCIPICRSCADLETKEATVGFRYTVFEWFNDRAVREEVELDLVDATGSRSLLMDIAAIEVPRLDDRVHPVG
jgi:hypothetical protein